MDPIGTISPRNSPNVVNSILKAYHNLKLVAYCGGEDDPCGLTGSRSRNWAHDC